jgi:transcriptional regulator with PAS, ATPase and Fis domain
MIGRPGHDGSAVPSGSLSRVDLLHAMVEGADDGLVVVDARGGVRAANGIGRGVAGLRTEAIVGEALARGGAVAEIQTLPDGRTLLVSARPAPALAGAVVLTLRDVSEVERLMARWQRSAEAFRQHERTLRAATAPAPAMVAGSAPMRAAREMALRCAAADLPVLLLGETGTGKGLFAVLIHEASARRAGPFVEVNCGAIPDGLVEAELFGYARGAFTGADARGKPGLVEAAAGGTLLLDEVAELPLALQVKLLRFLEGGEIRPVGGVRGRRPDVRIVAATNQDLAAMVARGTFRADLYYRLNVLTLRLPPLREHAEDVPALVALMLARLEPRLRRRLSLTPAALARLAGYAFPGNVRELANLIDRLAVTAPSDTVDVADLPPEVTAPATPSPAPGRLRDAVQSVEAALLRDALVRYGTQERAARHLGVGQATVARKARRYGLNGPV